MKKKFSLINIVAAVATVFVVSQVQAAEVTITHNDDNNVTITHNGDNNVTILEPTNGNTIAVRCESNGVFTRKRYNAIKVSYFPSGIIVITTANGSTIMSQERCGIND